MTDEQPDEVSATTAPWWENAVVYQVYPRSFSDSDGDGVGDLRGIVDRLGYLELLGVDAIWLSPIMRSPGIDHGYDVSDPRSVDPLFGDLAMFDALVALAGEHGIRVMLDVVPNHTSDQHPWFVEALAAEPGSPARARYHFRDGRGENGSEPPNNWESIFGGPAWTRVCDADGNPGQWYLHLFAPEQPDLNWSNGEVVDDLRETLRFWLRRGVAGFRVDVAHGMAKPAGLPDAEGDDDPRFGDPGVHDIHRMIRSVLDEFPGAVAVGEVWADDQIELAEYLRPDELHLAFDFAFTKAPFEADAIRRTIMRSLESTSAVDGTPTWTLSNHDLEREVTRLGGGDVGVTRARAMILVALALPGPAFIYNGAELGLPSVTDLPDEVLTDPVWERSGHTDRGRDHCRVPLPWEGTEPPFGFSPSSATWLPIPAAWKSLTVEAQLEDVASTLSLYRAAIEFRKTLPTFAGDTVEWYGAPDNCFAFRRPGGLICVLNTGILPVPLPPGKLELVSSALIEGELAPGSAAWLTLRPEDRLDYRAPEDEATVAASDVDTEADADAVPETDTDTAPDTDAEVIPETDEDSAIGETAGEDAAIDDAAGESTDEAVTAATDADTDTDTEDAGAADDAEAESVPEAGGTGEDSRPAS